MPKRNRSENRRDHEAGAMTYRTLTVRSSSIDIEGRSIEADISTENPVMMPDFERGEMIPEVLLSSGCELPASRQVPLLDSHQRASVKNQLGSIRGLENVDGRNVGRLHFSAAAEDEWTKVREGHVTDVSAGYEVRTKIHVKRGDTQKIQGREFTGPVNVATKWRMREGSITPIGADDMAKMRGLDPNAVRFLTPNESEFEMNPKLRAAAVARGMSLNLTDEDAQNWIAENMSAPAGGEGEKAEPMTEEEAAADKKKKQAEEDAGDAPGMKSLGDIESRMATMIDRAVSQREAKRAAFVTEVDSLCNLTDLTDEAAKCRELPTLEAVRKYLTDAKAERAKSGYVKPQINVRLTGNTGAKELCRDMGTALNLRALQAVATKPGTIDKVLPVAERGKGHETFQYATPYQMAEELVRAMGVNPRGMTREDVAKLAMFGPEVAYESGVRSFAVRDAAYHVTGSFANLTLDAMNKSMRTGYDEVPQTWSQVMRTGPSVPDFKNIHRLQLSGVGNLPVWNDNTDPERATVSDSKESYAVEARSLSISYSFRLLVNDDMDQLSRTPALLGAAAARTVNAVAWSQVTSNPTLAFDGKALFLETPANNRFRKNLTTGAGAPSVTTVGALTALMRLMRGQNVVENGTHAEGVDILNLSPAYIVGPAELETTINQLVNSAYDPAATLNQVYNPSRVLTPVIEPLLSVASATAWYLVSKQVDGIEMTFMQGYENPQTRNFLDPKKLSQEVTILQIFGAKALDFRGWQKHAGA